MSIKLKINTRILRSFCNGGGCAWKRRLAVLLIGVLVLPIFNAPAYALFGYWKTSTVPDVQREKLVSILVEEGLLENTKLKHKIAQYATNVQTKVNGKVVFIPIPTDASPLDIYEGNAHLYFSGVESDGRSQLIGTVLIGNVPLPIVEKKGNLWPTIFPYVDFEDPVYEWDYEKKRFVFEGGSHQPEIWHGVIRSDPRTGEGWDEKKLKKEREDELIAFFETNDQVHSGDISFDSNVFFADLPSQAEGLGVVPKGQYEFWIENLEDVAYMRFTKHWAQEMLTDTNVDNVIDIDILPDDMKPGAEALPASDLMKNVPDIHTKLIIENSMRRYFETWKNKLSLINERIGKAGRWNPEDIDTTITLVSVKDENSAVVLKNFNDLLESVLNTALTANNVAADVKVKTTESVDIDYIIPLIPPVPMVQSRDKDVYWNGVLRSDMTVTDCSLLRGSPRTTDEPHAQMVEANRAYNPLTTDEEYPTADDPDYLCENLLPSTGTTPNWSALNSWWNDDDDEDGTNNYEDINNDVYEGCCAINTQLNAESMSYENDYCEIESEWVIRDYLGLGALTPYPPAGNDDPTLTNQYREHVGATEALFDITATKEVLSGTTGAEGCATILDGAGDKTFNSLSFHVEPTAETISAQMENMGSIAMPVDSPRGFSFYDTGWNFQRLDYFNAFNFIGRHSDVTDSEVRKELLKQEILDALQADITEINAVNAGTALLTTLFDPSTNDLDSVVEAIMWIDKSLSEKNRLVFENAFSPVNIVQDFFLDDDFHDGYEFAQIIAPPGEEGEQEGIEMAFEHGTSTNSELFRNTLLETIAFSFDEAADQDTTDNHFDFGGQSDSQSACNGKNILTWFPCFLEWLSALPDFLTQEFILLPDSAGAEGGEQNGTVEKPNVIDPTSEDTSFLNTIETVEVSVPDIHIGAGDGSPIVLKIDLKNQKGSTIPDGSDVEVELTFDSSGAQQFFDIFPTGKIHPIGGTAIFTLFPKPTQVGGKFSLHVEVEGTVQQTIPITISTNTISLLFERTYGTVDDTEGVLLTAKIKDPERMVSRTQDGKILQFFSDWGRFEGGGKAMIREGKAEILFFPGIRSGTATVSAQDTKKTLPPAHQTINLNPGNPAEIVLDTETQFLIHGADFVPVKAQLTDRFGNDLRSTSGTFLWSTENLEVRGQEDPQSFETTPEAGASEIFVRSQEKLSFATLGVSLNLPEQQTDEESSALKSFMGTIKEALTPESVNDKSKDIETEESLLEERGSEAVEASGAIKTPEESIESSSNKTPVRESVPGSSLQEPSSRISSMLQTSLIREEETGISEVETMVLPSKEMIPPIQNSSLQNDGEKENQSARTEEGNTSTENKEGIIVGQQQTFVVPPQAVFILETDSETLEAGEEEAITVLVRAETEEGVPLQKTVPMGILADREDIGQFQKTFVLQDGLGSFSFFAGGKSGEVELSLTSPGFETASILLTVQPGDPVKIIIGTDAQTMDLDDEHAEINMDIQVVDRFGNRATSFNDTVYLLPNEPDILPSTDRLALINMGVISAAEGEQLAIEQAAAADRAGGTSPDTSLVQIEDGWSVPLVQGESRIQITPNAETGIVRMSVRAPELVPETVQFSITDYLTLDEIDALTPKALFTLLLGIDGGNPLPGRTTGSRFLFSGKTQALGTLIAPPSPAKQLGFLSPKGVLSQGLQAKMRTGQDWFEAFILDDTRTLSTVRVQFKEVVELFVKKEKGTLPGIYFIPEEAQIENLIRTENTIVLSDIPIFEIGEQGAVVPLFGGLSFEAQKGSYLHWDVLMGTEKVGILSIVPESMGILSVENQSDIPPQEAGIFVLPEVTDIRFAPLFTGKTTQEEQGIVLLDPTKKEGVTRILGAPHKSAENAQQDEEIVWTEGWKPGTLFAAGNIVGTATQWNSSDAFLLLGDPTMSVASENSRSSLGFTDDIGAPIWKSLEGQIDQIIVGDINGDEVPDILNLVGKKLFALYQENSEIDNFRDVGPILRFPDGVQTVLPINNDQDNFTDILQLNEEGELVLHKNINGTFAREIASLNGFEGTIQYMDAGNINDDAFKEDLVFTDEDRNLWVAFGTVNPGFFDPVEKIESFTQTLDPIIESYIVAEQQDWVRRKYFDTGLFPNLEHVFISHEAIENDITDQTPEAAIWKIGQESFLPDNAFERGLGEGGFHLNFGGVPITKTQLDDMTSSLQGGKKTMDEQLGIMADIVLEGTTGTFKKTFLEIPFQTRVDAEFVLKLADDELKVETGNILQAEITFTPKVALNSFEFLLPILYGLELVPDSFSCDTCTGELSFREELPKDVMLWGYFEQSLSVGEQVHLTWELEVEDLEPLSFQLFDFKGNDTMDDILIGWEQDGDKQLVQYVSHPENTGSNTFKYSQIIETITPPATPTAPAESSLTNAYKADSDSNGLPDSYDTFGLLDFASMTCKSGCGLPVPSIIIPPFAPGKQTLYIPPIGVNLPPFPTPTPALSFTTAAPYVYPFTPQGGPGSIFRMYTMPTTTGKIGISFCAGLYPTGMVAAQFPAGNCITVFPPIMEVLGVCSADDSDGGTTSDSLRNKVDNYDSAEFKPEFDFQPPNTSIKATEIISNWIDAQKDEWSNIKLPTPKLWTPKMLELPWKAEDTEEEAASFGKDTHVLGRGLWKSLEKKPWITVEPQLFTFPYPLFPKASSEAGQKELAKYKIQWEVWKEAGRELKQQKTVIQERYNQSCLNPKNEDQKKKCVEFLKNLVLIDRFTDSIEQNAQVIENNWEAIKSYKKMPETLKKLFKDDERGKGDLTRLGKQFQKYADEIETYISEWLEANKKAVEKWKKFVKELREFLKGFDDLLEPFTSFNANCPTCSVERGTSTTVLINLLLGSVELPVIPAPRLPDILLDFSRIDFTVLLPVPEIEFQPVEVGYPDIPPPPEINLPSFNFEKSISLPDIPVLSMLPAMPDINISIPIPNLPLPMLPVLLDPPGLPDIFVSLQPIVNLLQKFIDLFCLIVQGYIPVPEHYLAGHVQQMTNRTMLFGIDLTAPSFAPNVPQMPEIDDIAITIEAHIKLPTVALELINESLGILQGFDECMVNSLVQVLKGAPPEKPCSYGNGGSTAFLPSAVATNEVKYNIVANIDSPHESSPVVPLTSLAEKVEDSVYYFATLFRQQKTNVFSTIAPERFSRWLTSTIDVGAIPTEAPTDFDTDALLEKQNKAFQRLPAVYYLDPATGVSEKVTEFPMDNLTAHTFADLGNDKNEEVLYALGDELFLKYRVVPTIDEDDLEKKYEQKYRGDYEDRFGKFIRWDYETFREKFAPAKDVQTSVETEGATIQFERVYNGNSYFEWVVSDRPDFVFERTADTDDRISEQWDRHAFLLRPEPVQYEIRPMTTQITDIKGSPLLYASPSETILRMKQKDCDDENAEKPFFAEQSLLVGIDTYSRFEIRVPPRPGRPERLEEKVLRKGEETIVEYGEICLTRGDVQRISMTEIERIDSRENTYLPSGARMELGSNDRVKIKLFDGTEVTIRENEKYTLRIFDQEDELIRAFEQLKKTNQYGIFQSFTEDGDSFFFSKFLHDPQEADDTTLPAISFIGGKLISAKIFQGVSVDASRTRDKEGGIARVWWDLYPTYDGNGDGDPTNDQDFPDASQTGIQPRELLKVTLPPYETVGIFSVVLHVEDKAGNHAQETLTIEVEIPAPELQEATIRGGRVLGSIRDAVPDIPIIIERNRKDKWEPIRPDVLLTDNYGDFSLSALQSSGGVSIQDFSDKEAFDVLENGRPILYNDLFDIKVEGATSSHPTRILLGDEQRTTISMISFSISGENDVVLDTESITFSELPTVHVLDRNTNDRIDFQVTEEGNVLLSKGDSLALIDKRGDFYGMGKLQIKATSRERDPVVFEILGEEGVVWGEFIIGLGDSVTTNLEREKSKESAIQFIPLRQEKKEGARVDILPITSDNLPAKNEN